MIGHCGGLLIQREARRVQSLQPHQCVSYENVSMLKLGQVRMRPAPADKWPLTSEECLFANKHVSPETCAEGLLHSG